MTDADATDTHTITASSSASGVATVSANGMSLMVAAVGEGSATISVTARDNSGAANAESAPVSFDVRVEAANQRPMVGAIADRSLEAGGSVDIPVEVTDDDADDTHTISASSSDSGLVEVSVEGSLLSVRGLAAGSATITVTARDSSGAGNAESEPVTFAVTVKGGWIEGVFEPAGNFKNFCANPRQPDPLTGGTFRTFPVKLSMRTTGCAPGATTPTSGTTRSSTATPRSTVRPSITSTC